MESRPLIGMMLGWKTRRPDLMRAFTLAAAYYGADLYHFRTSDVGKKTIRGTHLVDNEWVDAEFRYPDVIYDSTRRRGIAPHEEAYRKLGGIPMGHTLKGRAMNKVRVYNMIAKNKELSQALIPFQRMTDPQRVMKFLHEHPQIIFKPNGGYLGKGAITAEFKDDTLELFDQQYLHRLTSEQIPTFIEMLITQKYIVQKMIHSATAQGFPFHLRVHMSKNGHNEWVVAFKTPTMSLTPHVKITNSDETFKSTCTWRDFLKEQFGQKENGRMNRKIDSYSLQLSRYLDETIGGGFHEIGLDLGIDRDQNIWLFEAGIGLPRTSFFYMQLALPAVAYTLSLLHPSEPV